MDLLGCVLVSVLYDAELSGVIGCMLIHALYFQSSLRFSIKLKKPHAYIMIILKP